MPAQAMINDAGWVLLAAALVWYGLLLQRLLKILGKPPAWIWLMAGAAMLIIFVTGHIVAYSQFVPYLPAPEAFRGLWLCRFVSFAAVFASGLLTTIVNWMYYRWTA